MTKKRTCVTEGCGSRARESGELCDRHQRMQDAPPCTLEHCDRPQYARSLCEAHYRRKSRQSEKWDGPIIRTSGDLVFIATRVTPEVREALEGTLGPNQKLYGKLAEIVDEWLTRKKLAPKAHAA